MMLVDPKVLSGLNNLAPPVSDPVSDVLKRLDNDIMSVLNRRDTPLSVKLDQYNEVLTDYLHKVREYKNSDRRMVTPPLSADIPAPPAARVTEDEQ